MLERLLSKARLLLALLALLPSAACVYDLDSKPRPGPADNGVAEQGVDQGADLSFDSGRPPLNPDGGLIPIHGDLGLGILSANCATLPGVLNVATVVHKDQTGGTAPDAGMTPMALLKGPTGIALGSVGGVPTAFIADTQNHRIATANLTTTHTALSTFAGSSGEADFVDGPRLTQAKFNTPMGIATTSAAISRLYVADTWNHRIRKVEPVRVNLLAGTGHEGSVDGPAASATFSHPTGLLLTQKGKLLVVDRSAHCIRQIDLEDNDKVTTIAGKCEPSSPGFLDGPALSARFNSPIELALDPNGAVYITDSKNHAIRVLHRGNVYTVTGLSGSSGYLEGKIADAKLNAPLGITMGENGEALFFTDSGNERIRNISCGRVGHIAGSGTNGYLDGAATSAEFRSPSGLFIHADVIYLSDTGNDAIRKVFCPVGCNK
jgi:sugar lactone lactonase YvrE